MCLLAGCASKEQVKETAAPAPEYRQISQDTAKEMMAQDDGIQGISPVRSSSRMKASEQQSRKGCPTRIRSFWFTAAAATAADRPRKSLWIWGIPGFTISAAS